MTINVNKILVPVDFSLVSPLSIEYAASMAEKFDAQVLVINVVESEAVFSVGLSDPVNVKDKWDKEAHGESKAKLIELCDKLSQSVKVETRVCSGDVSASILACLSKDKCDMLIMGAHGSSGVLSDWLGGVAYKISKKAACPVLMVRQNG